MSRRRLLGLLCVLVALPAAGCGFGSGESTGDVSLNVTRDFGGERLHEGIEEHATEGDTVMRLLERNYEIDTRYGGGFVQDIEGVGGGREDGRRVDWFYYVNGIEASIGAAERRVAAGERVWWDHHAWEAAQRVPAVVGFVPGAVQERPGGEAVPGPAGLRRRRRALLRRGHEAARGLGREGGLALGARAVRRRGGPARRRRPLGRRAA